MRSTMSPSTRAGVRVKLSRATVSRPSVVTKAARSSAWATAEEVTTTASNNKAGVEYIGPRLREGEEDVETERPPRTVRAADCACSSRSVESELLLGGGRQEAVQPEIVGALTVVIRPVADGHEHDAGARPCLSAEEWQFFAHLRVVELRERLIAKGEGFLQLARQFRLAAGTRDLGTRGGLGAADQTAEIVIPLDEMGDDIAEAHLRGRRLVAVLVGGHRVGGSDQVLGGRGRLGAKSLGDRSILRRHEAREYGERESHRDYTDTHGRA